MALEWQISSSKLVIKTKAGTLASGADSVKTMTFSGALPDADGSLLLATADAIESVSAYPTLEVLQENDYEVVETEVEEP